MSPLESKSPKALAPLGWKRTLSELEFLLGGKNEKAGDFILDILS